MVIRVLTVTPAATCGLCRQGHGCPGAEETAPGNDLMDGVYQHAMRFALCYIPSRPCRKSSRHVSFILVDGIGQGRQRAFAELRDEGCAVFITEREID